MRKTISVIAFAVLTVGVPGSPKLAQDKPEATIAALQTQVAGLTTPTAVLRQPTPASTGGTRYPSAVGEIVAKDSATGCDNIGWARPSGQYRASVNSSSRLMTCVGEGGYTMGCFDLTQPAEGRLLGPQSGDMWIGCVTQAINQGVNNIDVSPLYFSLVTADNKRYNTSFDPMAAFPNAELLQAGSVPPRQYVEGWVFFVADQTDEQPFHVEIEPLAIGLRDQERGVVIIDELLDPDELART